MTRENTSKMNIKQTYLHCKLNWEDFYCRYVVCWEGIKQKRNNQLERQIGSAKYVFCEFSPRLCFIFASVGLHSVITRDYCKQCSNIIKERYSHFVHGIRRLKSNTFPKVKNQAFIVCFYIFISTHLSLYSLALDYFSLKQKQDCLKN